MAENEKRLQFLLSLMEIRGVSKHELARMMGVSPQNIFTYLKRDDMKLSYAQEIAGKLGYDISYRLEKEGEGGRSVLTDIEGLVGKDGLQRLAFLRVAMGRYDDARKLFEDTTDFYLREQGLRPTEKMMELLEQLGDGMGHSYGFLEEIQGGMTEYRSHVDGGYVCNFPVFRGVYRTLSRMVERTGLSVYLMLCTIVDTKGNPMREGPILDRLTVRLKEAISQSTRYSDIINQYGPGQYLILLTNTTMENCEVVQSRIDERFLSVRQRTGVVYHVKAVEGLQDDE